MRFRTETVVERSAHEIDYSKPIVMLGSCFADEISQRLSAGGFEVVSNPFGTLYNPASIAHSILRIADGRPYDASELREIGGQFVSWDHNTKFSGTQSEPVLSKINSELGRATEALRRSSTLIVTPGTARVWRLKSENRIVSNCHKQPAVEFEHQTLSVSQCVSVLKHAFKFATAYNPGLKIIVTISPVRYKAYGLHESNVDKSILMMATDELCSLEGVEYFPAYEALIDDLRDYRFYSDDLVHPSKMAVDYVFELFAKTFFSPAVAEKSRLAALKARQYQHVNIN